MTPNAKIFHRSDPKPADKIIQILFVRNRRWINALVAFIMLMSGLIRFQPMAACRNFRKELKRLLIHGTGEYNPLPRVLFIALIWVGVLLVFSGLTMWTQVHHLDLAHFFGGYDQARKIPFFAMFGLTLSTIMHVSIATAVKDTIESMIEGQLVQKPPKKIGALK